MLEGRSAQLFRESGEGVTFVVALNRRAVWHMLFIPDFKQTDFRIGDGLLDGTTRRGRSDFRQHHRQVGFAAECDGLGDFPCARTIDNASHHAQGLRGGAGDMFPHQVSSVAVWH